MTDYIEQMMKTAGVKKCEHFRQYNYAQVPYGKEELKKSQDNGIECIRIRNCTDENNTCIYWTELSYPAFTAEKQLEIIKLIGFNSSFSLKINKFGCSPTTEDKYRLTYSEHKGFKIFQSFNPDFTQALAQLTTELMNTDELDKEKVKEILEG